VLDIGVGRLWHVGGRLHTMGRDDDPLSFAPVVVVVVDAS
jgi:hypothetical protein